MDCHAIRARMRRRGLQYRLRPLYWLKRSEFDAARSMRPIRIVAELSGLSPNTLHEYCYHGVRAPRDKASAVALFLDVPFQQIWRNR